MKKLITLLVLFLFLIVSCTQPVDKDTLGYYSYTTKNEWQTIKNTKSYKEFKIDDNSTISLAIHEFDNITDKSQAGLNAVKLIEVMDENYTPTNNLGEAEHEGVTLFTQNFVNKANKDLAAITTAFAGKKQVLLVNLFTEDDFGQKIDELIDFMKTIKIAQENRFK